MRELQKWALKQLKDLEMPVFTGPLMCIIHFRMPYPVSRNIGFRKRRHMYPVKSKPDGDNLEKFFNDAMNGIIWKDDAQIVWMVRSKTYTYERKGETILHVFAIEDDLPDYENIIENISKHISIE